MIHTLPAQYPFLSSTDVDLNTEASKKISSIVFKQTEKVILQKLSNLPSHDSLQELLTNFVHSKKAEVFLLIANMDETSYKIINHVRIMIEEEELKIHNQQCKLFVLLLHFPPTKFFKHCYPALFLKGWDFTYLDTIMHGSDVEKGIIDIQDWFHKGCFPEEEQDSTSIVSGQITPASSEQLSLDIGQPSLYLQPELDALLQTLHHLLPQIILPLAAGGYFGMKSDDSFNSNMNATQRGKALEKLLFDKHLDSGLCEMFRTYWTPKVMMEYLMDAATFSIQRESTLNITESIQTKFKSLFTYFCIFMLIQANEDFNLDILYADNPSNNIFLELFNLLPVPKLSTLSFQGVSLPNFQDHFHQPQFPFFKRVYILIESQIDISQERASLMLSRFHQGQSKDASINNFNDDLQRLIQVLVDDLTELKQKVYVHVMYELQFTFFLIIIIIG